MTTILRILLLADTADRYSVISAALADQAMITPVNAVQDLILTCVTTPPDLILLSSSSTGTEWLTWIAAAGQYAPVMVLAQTGTAASAVQIMQAGAVNYLLYEEGFESRLRDAVQAIKPGQAGFHITCQNAPVMMQVFDHKGIILDVNVQCVTELGYTRQEMIGQPITTWMLPDSAADVSKRILPQLWEAGTLAHAPHRYRCQDNHVIDVLLSASVVPGEGDERVAVCVLQNITDQKQIELAEREQRVLAEALRDTTAAMNSTLDFDEVLDRILANVARVVPYDTGNIMLVEGRRARMVRNQRASEPGREIHVPTASFEITSTPTLRWMYENIRPLAIPDTRAYAEWVELPQSMWIQSFVGAPIIEEGRVIGYITLNSGTKDTFTDQHAERLAIFAHHAGIAIRNARLFDSAQRHASELEKRVARRTAQLNIERNHLRAILEATGEGIVYAESDNIEYVNRAFTAMTGYKPGELVGQKVDVLDTRHYIRDHWPVFQPVLLRGETWRDEIRLTRHDGTEFDAGISISLSSQPGDHPTRTVTVVRDISREKQLEMQKANFIATASHELRTPITNILTRLYLMKHQPEKLHEHMQVLNEVTRRMQRLVEDLLDMSRFERGVIRLERQRVELQQMLSDVVRVQYAEAQAKNIALKIDLTAAPQYVEADAERLTQVITNLVTNALVYTPAGGEVRVGLTTANDNAIISVEDTGIGIAPENLIHIFEPFVRVDEKVKGTGLGLSIAKEIVEMHGGSIAVSSEPGQGSRFDVTLKLLPVLA